MSIFLKQRLPLTRMLFVIRILLLFCMMIAYSKPTYAGKIALLPTKTPHLNAKQLQVQMKTFEKNLKSLGGLQMISSHLVAQTLKSIGQSNPIALDRQNITELCEIFQSDGLLASEMILAKGQQKAKFEIKLYVCQDPRILEDVIVFNGKLSQSVWDQICSKSDLLINTMLSVPFQYSNTQFQQDQRDAFQDLQNQAYPFDGDHQSTQDQNIQDQNDASAQNHLSQNQISTLRLDRIFAISAGASFFNYSLKYQTQSNSPSQRAGLDFQSQWFTGYQIKVAFQPFSKLKNFLKKFSFSFNYQYYAFKTVQVLPRLFDEDELRSLDSSLQNLSYGGYFLHPIQRGFKTHLIGFFTKIQNQKIQIDRNLEYQGHAYQALQIGFFGQLCAMPSTFLVDLEVSVLPYLKFNQSIKEFGGQANSIGGQVKVTMHYLLANLFSIDLQLQGQMISHQLSGAGRGGRLGKAMDEQSLQGMLGFSIYLF